MEYIRLKEENSVWELCLARPEKRNALNREMVVELQSALDKAAESAVCRALVIKADGDAFCAGADLQYIQDLQTFTLEQNREDSLQLANLFTSMFSFPKYLITQVDGPALAGGCGLATIGDFCFATPESSFGYTEARIGFIPAIVMVFLIRKIGDQKARELMLTADIISGEHAKQYGLVYQTVPKDQLDSHVTDFANKMIRRNSSQSVSGIKKMMVDIADLKLDDAIELAAMGNAEARASSDCKKGIAAFLNKERPKWD